MKRVFLSFHYSDDSIRVQQIKNVGAVEGQTLLSYNQWEAIKRNGDPAIKNWINGQMNGRSCMILLIGSNTANRKWINYEISHAWDNGKSIAGLYINKLKDFSGYQSAKGSNPFDYIYLKDGKRLSEHIPCFEPTGATSKEAYDWIKNNIESIVERAVKR